MNERVKFVAAMLEAEESFGELRERFGISRKQGYKWREALPGWWCASPCGSVAGTALASTLGVAGRDAAACSSAEEAPAFGGRGSC